MWSTQTDWALSPRYSLELVMQSVFDVVVVGAGAAGLAAARDLIEAGLSVMVLEGSHRIGGRAFTEHLPDGSPFDLGCHWMHSASINPFVAIADQLGFRYDIREGYGLQLVNQHGAWLDHSAKARLSRASDEWTQAIRRSFDQGLDHSLYEATDQEGEWRDLLNYWVSLDTSVDVDQVAVGDLINYVDTNENWPVMDGYGDLVAHWARGIPVALNSMVTEIDWSRQAIRVRSTRGDLSSRFVVMTVSTGVLNEDVIRFIPHLPTSTLDAIAGLPLGNYNRIRLSIAATLFDTEIPERIVSMPVADQPMSLSIRPYGRDCVIGLVGGRYADYLEKAGQKASRAVVLDHLRHVFGGDLLRHIKGDRQSAWRGDPLIKGAYSAAAPGQSFQRAVLSQTLHERLLFAGEATSPDQFSTCHGAALTGRRAAAEIISLSQH